LASSGATLVSATVGTSAAYGGPDEMASARTVPLSTWERGGRDVEEESTRPPKISW
jgi:hypothetical protein